MNGTSRQRLVFFFSIPKIECDQIHTRAHSSLDRDFAIRPDLKMADQVTCNATALVEKCQAMAVVRNIAQDS